LPSTLLPGRRSDPPRRSHPAQKTFDNTHTANAKNPTTNVTTTTTPYPNHKLPETFTATSCQPPQHRQLRACRLLQAGWLIWRRLRQAEASPELLTGVVAARPASMLEALKARGRWLPGAVSGLPADPLADYVTASPL
jgi:hypothetical protein